VAETRSACSHSTGRRTLCCGTPRHCTRTTWPLEVQLHHPGCTTGSTLPGEPLPCDLPPVASSRHVALPTLQVPPSWPRAGVPFASSGSWPRQAQQPDRGPSERRHAASMRSRRWQRAPFYATNIDCAAILGSVRAHGEASTQQRCSGSVCVRAARECAARSGYEQGARRESVDGGGSGQRRRRRRHAPGAQRARCSAAPWLAAAPRPLLSALS
jgi:hypothetical protein